MRDFSRDPIYQPVHILTTKDDISVGILRVDAEMLKTHLLKTMTWGHVSSHNNKRSYNILYSWGVFKTCSRWNIY